MIVPRLIERKRDGERLEPGELRELILAYARGKVPDYQMAALLMAVYFRGLDRAEMNELMEEWKKIGPVPKEHLSDLWEQFISARRFFFDRKDADRERRLFFRGPE